MLKISPLFSDGAVLCRRKEIRVFGEAEEGAEVHCELRDERNGLLAQGDGTACGGKFLILLDPQEARTGCRLVIASGEESFCSLDLSIGEVYLAGGQSNMELELQNADEGPGLIAGHVNPMVRYFNVPKHAWMSEAREEAWRQAGWQAIGPGRGRDMSAVAYFFAMKLQRHLQIPVGIIDCYWGGTSATCWMDEDWLKRTGEGQRYWKEYADLIREVTLEEYLEKERAFFRSMEEWNGRAEKYRAEHPGGSWDELVDGLGGPLPWNPPAGPASPYRPAGLYQSMVEPLLPMTLTGILFYQGEEDAWRTKAYDTLMTSLINRWRTAFRDESLPFLFVQLPMWIDKGAEDSKNWPALRLRQSEVRDRMRNTGMVCLLDQGEFNNIHPTNKRVVGERLFELAKTLVYHQEGAAAPRVTGKKIEGSMMTLQTDQLLMTRDGKEPALLELAGADGSFVPARAMIEGPMLHLTAAGVDHPLHARYAWTDYGTVNLFAANGLPLEPFAF